MRRQSHRLRKNEEGLTALEFALIAPAMLGFMFGIIETGMVMFVQSTLENATNTASRLGKTGYSAAGISREQTIRDALNSKAGGFLDSEKLVFTTTVYDGFDTIGDAEPYQDANDNSIYDAGESYTDINGNGQWDIDIGQAGFGNAGDVVVYTISYPWNIVTPIVSNYMGENGIFNVTTRLVVKNEPFEGAVGGA